jgi:hypothetical protein
MRYLCRYKLGRRKEARRRHCSIIDQGHTAAFYCLGPRKHAAELSLAVAVRGEERAEMGREHAAASMTL